MRMAWRVTTSGQNRPQGGLRSGLMADAPLRTPPCGLVVALHATVLLCSVHLERLEI